jgi:glutamine synthetase
MNARTETKAAAPKTAAHKHTHQRHDTVFKERVFDAGVQELYLPKKIVQHLEECRAGKTRFDTSYADAIAEGLKNWALKNGANAYTHWFQPLTHLTAEKHDSFLAWGPEDRAVDRFRGKELLFGEPDASSFPSGGLRATHEARGYTAWDPASLPFIWESAEGLILCIPSVFYSWKGDALDHKIPLLRSDQKIQAAAMRLLALCKIKAGAVFSTLGAEQEYFLIERSLYALRPDLVLAGRTVFGANPPKGQELEDHYFGALKDRVMAFMLDFEEAALKLGIPVKTRHNEVAPAQYETAPLFEKASIAADHNLALMEVMRQSAAKHDLACLFHEKPFAGINGSGKHNNWSLATDTGVNLLDPKESSLLFVTLLTSILRAVHEHAGLVRASIATAGNDHRLGVSEAPPSIFSVSLGEVLQKIIQEIIQEKPSSLHTAQKIDIGLEHFPAHDPDSSDRNRTSFFAFTGNKFEFRAVGASASCALPISILNAIVADSLELILDEIEGALKDRKECTLEIALPVLRKHLIAASPAFFEGNAYSSEWHGEAEKRGLLNIRRSFHSYDQFLKPKSIRVLDGVMSEKEIACRFKVFVEQYAKTMSIESNLMIEIFQTQILPAVQQDLHRRFAMLQAGASVGIPSSSQKKLAEKVSATLDEAMVIADEIALLKQQVSDLGWEAKAKVFCELIAPKMEEMRKKVDALEGLVEDDLWPLPKYREMLFQI